MLNIEYIKNNIDFPLYYFESIDSTSDYAKNVNLDSKALVIAETQTRGRGRQGKSFYSPKGGLYFSFAFRDNADIDLNLFTIRIAVIVREALAKDIGSDFKIKWVNDIFLNDKKVSGILCEHVNGIYVIGIGVDCFSENFPEELENTATQIKLNSKEDVILSILRGIQSDMDDSLVLSEYRKYSYLNNKTVVFELEENKYQGTVLDIDNEGCLIVECNGKEYRLGSVSVNIVNI